MRRAQRSARRRAVVVVLLKTGMITTFRQTLKTSKHLSIAITRNNEVEGLSLCHSLYKTDFQVPSTHTARFTNKETAFTKNVK